MSNSTEKDDLEANRLSRRVQRYASVSAKGAAAAARIAGARVSGTGSRASEADILRSALGGLKGPLMKAAQLLATIPDALPADYARELAQLQNNAPPMGWPFVRRRMAAELGQDWQGRFKSFERDAAAAASLGQVHRAITHDGVAVACKLQYPDMQSAVEADLSQLKMLFGLHRRYSTAIDTSEIRQEIAARLREELDYGREAGHMRLYSDILRDFATIRVPGVNEDLSTGRLLTMDWLTGDGLLDFREASLEVRNLLATHMFQAWWEPFCGYGVIHGDPHLGNYSAWLDDNGEPMGLNLLDYGCIRVFPSSFVTGVAELYHGLREDDYDRTVSAYEIWGFSNLSRELVDTLNIWARFIYGPLMLDKVQTLAGVEVSAGEYGRKQAFAVHQKLKALGPLKVPREFVFMDRAAIGLGSVFIHLRAELNFYELFHAAMDRFGLDGVGDRQATALKRAGLA